MESKIKVIIAEDHLDSQEIIAEFLKPLNNFEIIGEAEDGERLLELVINSNPDLIIADINMPKLNGIEAISACLKINNNIQFIFITAYDNYALNAFDLNAVDYIMKPIKKERFYVALEKAKSVLSNQKLKEVTNILTIKVDRTSYFIPQSRIIFIEKDNRKTVIHTVERKYETNEPLDNMMSKLDDHFIRTHRSFIINKNFLSHITLEGDTYFAHFRDYLHVAHVSKLQRNKLLKGFK